MILALVSAAAASSCCSGGGGLPSVLGACDTLAVSTGVGGDLQYGGWSWDGRWSGVGDDGAGDVTVSAALMGRFTPWLQGGLRVPLNLGVHRLDGVTQTELGLGSGLAWLELESPSGWPSARSHLALDLGVGLEGPTGATPGATVVQAGVRASGELRRWTLWGDSAVRVPVSGGSALDADASVVLDRELSRPVRIGLGVGGQLTADRVPSLAASVGPILVLRPDNDDRIVLSVRTGIPATGFGQNASTRLLLTLDWYRVLSHTRV